MVIRSLLLTVLLSTASIIVGAQNVVRKNAIGIYQNFTDYNVSLLSNTIFSFDSALSQSVRVAYQRRLSSAWTLNTGINNGFILNQTLKESFVDKAYAIGADISIFYRLNNGRLIKEDALIGPFFSFGYRTDYVQKLKKVYDESPWLAHNQYGIGLNIRLASRTHLQLQSILDQKLQGDFNTHILYRVGVVQNLGKYEEVKPKPNKILDSDLDGIVDAKDNCPGRYGLKDNNGCPDTLVYEQNKIARDSLMLLAMTQQKRIDSLELDNATLRYSDDKNESGSKDIEKEYNAKLASLQKQISELESNTPKTITRVDTVYYEKTVYVEKAIDSSQLLADRAKMEKAKLEAEAKAQFVEQELRLEKERLAKLNEERAKAKLLEADRLAQEQKKTEEKESVKGPTKVDPNVPADKNYYVITISSPNIATAEAWLKKMKKDFKDARILPQPNGYYRVGVYAAKDREYSLRILEEIKAKGYNPAWLSVE